MWSPKVRLGNFLLLGLIRVSMSVVVWRRKSVIVTAGKFISEEVNLPC